MKEKVGKLIGFVVIINVLSRACALVAGTLITAFFGANAQTSAYSFALTLTSIVTTVIGTALTTAVIPIYTELLEKANKEKQDSFLGTTISLTVIFGAILSVIGVLVAPLAASLSEGGDYNFTVYSIRVLMPAVICISLYYVFSGILQSRGKFYLAAMVSIPSSFVNIIYILFLSKYYGVAGLVVSALIGFFLQAFILLLPIIKSDVSIKPKFDLKNPHIRRIFIMSGPVLIGVCAYQINLLTNGAIAYSYNSEKYIVLNNVQNLGIQIVMTIVLAIASVMYPKMSTLSAKEDFEGLNNHLGSTLNYITLLLIPISAGFIILSSPIVDVVYGYGKFGADDIGLGAKIFSLYAIGILGNGFKEIVDRAFYALKNTKISAYNGVLIMGVNIFLSVILVKSMGLGGIAIAYSSASLIGGLAILLLYWFKNKIFRLKPVFTTIFKSVIACVGMSAVVFILKTINLSGGKAIDFLWLAFTAIIGAITYAVLLYFMKTKEITEIFQIISVRLHREDKNA